MTDFKRRFDWLLLGLWVALTVYGIFAIYSASYQQAGGQVTLQSYYLKQSVWALVSLALMLIIIRVPYQVIEVFIWPVYGLTVLMLIAVLFMPAVKGAHRWLSLGFIGFQPSELGKLVCILAASQLLSKPRIGRFEMIWRGLAPILPVTMLILLEPDLSTTLVYFFCLYVMYGAAGLPSYMLLLAVTPLISMVLSFFPWVFVIFLVLLLYYFFRQSFSYTFMGFVAAINGFFAFLTPVLWNSLHTYQQERILTFIDPLRDPLGAGYQIIQAKIAIGSGGLWGKGYLEGTQKNLRFLPEHHNDFIFSVIGEELGFVGCVFLLGLFLALFSRMAWRLRKLAQPQYRIATAGIIAYLFFHTGVNIGMNLGLLPTTGVPLPFISYGGTNFVINTLAVAFVLKYQTVGRPLQ